MQQRSQRTLQRLLDSAADEFDRGGYARAKLDDIARTAGVTKGALYFHFSSKDELADAVQLRARDLLEGYLHHARDREPSALQRLVDSTHHLNLLLHRAPAVRASVRITRERSLRDPSPADYYRLVSHNAAQLIREAHDRAELGEGFDGLRPAQDVVTAITSGIEVLCWTGVPYAEAAHRLTALWDRLLPTLAWEGARGRIRTGPGEDPTAPRCTAAGSGSGPGPGSVPYRTG
ncbi:MULTISPECIES: ScbR family autoregulator-binding transcription factor [Streptomyces]|uniref:DNA-binding transcriptional regulator, AcrR family n=1 Tax=Streptomyces harbinensis TaxID=1176198 RepID=A0A1I6RVU8_9ACTN|nr:MULTISPECIES: ScbR family autoregulator-binding transcription factor [Streptomyces]SFS68837.1 DNA-binding transcriptional regulator, AcrR family [Streptomyces harbinensis]